MTLNVFIFLLRRFEGGKFDDFKTDLETLGIILWTQGTGLVSLAPASDLKDWFGVLGTNLWSQGLILCLKFQYSILYLITFHNHFNITPQINLDHCTHINFHSPNYFLQLTIIHYPKNFFLTIEEHLIDIIGKFLFQPHCHSGCSLLCQK